MSVRQSEASVGRWQSGERGISLEEEGKWESEDKEMVGRDK